MEDLTKTARGKFASAGYMFYTVSEDRSITYSSKEKPDMTGSFNVTFYPDMTYEVYMIASITKKHLATRVNSMIQDAINTHMEEFGWYSNV